AELLGVQAEGGLLRRVPADGYGAFDRLCNKLVPKTAFVLEVVIGHSAASSLLVPSHDHASRRGRLSDRGGVRCLGDGLQTLADACRHERTGAPIGGFDVKPP